MARIIAISNRKGGSGKTTSAVNIAAGLSHRKHRVALIDLDPQAHATISLGRKVDKSGAGIYRILTSGDSFSNQAAETYSPNLTLLPGSSMLHRLQRHQDLDVEALSVLRRVLQPVSAQFEYIVFDTPPTLGLLTLSAFVASTEVYIPLQTHYLALEGLAEIYTVIKKMRTRLGINLELAGVIPTFYQSNTNLAKGMIQEIERSIGRIIMHPIRQCIALAEAPGFGKSIFQYDIRSNGAADYLALVKQIEARVPDHHQ